MIKVSCVPQIGTDTEVFLQNEEGRIVPCVGLLKGTKEHPWTPKGYKKGFALQEDNVMCEFNVAPAKTTREGRENIIYARNMVETQVGKLDLTPAWGKTTHKFLKADLQTDQAKTFGCDPDFDAYNGGAIRNFPPAAADMLTRSCGGHIHFGVDFKCPDFVAALFVELMLGIMLNGTTSTAGEKNSRTKWYGAPGIFRPKPYGIEYRTPDSRWVADEYLVENVYSQGLVVARYLTENPADVLQKAFRAISWTKCRQFMKDGDPKLRNDVLKEARAAGVPV